MSNQNLYIDQKIICALPIDSEMSFQKKNAVNVTRKPVAGERRITRIHIRILNILQ